jgi:hypothetical protein
MRARARGFGVPVWARGFGVGVRAGGFGVGVRAMGRIGPDGAVGRGRPPQGRMRGWGMQVHYLSMDSGKHAFEGQISWWSWLTG